MGALFQMLGMEPKTDVERAVDRFYIQKIFDDVIMKGLPSNNRDLESENLRLTNMQMKRSLGIPLDDDDYEKMNNEEGGLKDTLVTIKRTKSYGKKAYDLGRTVHGLSDMIKAYR